MNTRRELENQMIQLTLDLMDKTDDMDLTEIGEGVVSQAWGTEFRFPCKTDLRFMTDDQLVEGILTMEDMLEWLEKEDLTFELLRGDL